MKNVLVILLVIVGFIADAQVMSPAPSPAATVSTVVGLTDVKVEYSRPKAKGRKIFGDGNLTPYGQIWRTGANSGSKITFGDDVKFGGMDVPKGTYLILTIPGATEWTVILYKDVAMGGNTGDYKQANDQTRVVVKSEKLTEKVETFTIEISDLSDNSKTANLQIMWENTSVKVPITVEFDTKVMKSIEASTKINPNNLFSAGVYYFENGKDIKQAYEWVSAAAAANPNAYWVAYQKAKIQKAMGDKKGAIESATASRIVAEKEKNMDYVKLNDDLIKSLK
ncbi:MAG: DUF2911 domain-containing protein [Cyclobacteriaceae bacterium]|nr:DUF2911 domain-containing protein [Cyclobacteriaceae bacterium]